MQGSVVAHLPVPADDAAPPVAARTTSATVGVVGAGQLARMLYEAASPLGIGLRVLAEQPDESAALVAKDVMLGSPRSPQSLAEFSAGNDVTTFDHELVDAAALAGLEDAGRLVRPSAPVVALVQDKLAQRATLQRAGFPVPPFRAVADGSDVVAFAAAHGWPVVVKALRGGYDGRGVWVLDDPDQAAAFGVEHDFSARPVLVEAFVPITRELAVLVARRPSGETAVYPVVETVQVAGICREIIAPAAIPGRLATDAHAIATGIADAIGSVGILAIELFESDGRLIVNELAARPHNSGHFTIEGCVTSQFEQHLRAVLDWPLGATDLVAPAVATVNILGDPSDSDPLELVPLALVDRRARVHLYGKSARPGRKLGHVTVLAGDPAEARSAARRAAAALSGLEAGSGWEP